jgi:hypothetical protein
VSQTLLLHKLTKLGASELELEAADMIMHQERVIAALCHSKERERGRELTEEEEELADNVIAESNELKVQLEQGLMLLERTLRARQRLPMDDTIDWGEDGYDDGCKIYNSSGETMLEGPSLLTIVECLGRNRAKTVLIPRVSEGRKSRAKTRLWAEAAERERERLGAG